VEWVCARATPEQRQIIEHVRDAARQTSTRIVLVGGAVRDALLGVMMGDLDFTVEGDAITFAHELQSVHGGEVTTHPRFRTATWRWQDFEIDFTTARTEHYARAAALPEITPSTIERDLFRRDATVNAIALDLTHNALIDLYDGVRDLRERTLRALHAQSFVDDPTRILRFARYAARFDFAVESLTRTWIDAGVPHVAELSGERIKYDLELIFVERDAAAALQHLNAWGVFRALGISIPPTDEVARRFACVHASSAWDVTSLDLAPQARLHAAGWGAINYNNGQLSISRWLTRIPFDAHLRDTLTQAGLISTISREQFSGRDSHSSQLLSGFGGLALYLAWLFDKDDAKRAAMHNEWHVWRRTQTALNGADLIALGAPKGPRIGEILAVLRAARIDGDVVTADDERAMAERLVSQI
jgi:tRNA nucleotidyltransferase (CCA-adding enzyme)